MCSVDLIANIRPSCLRSDIDRAAQTAEAKSMAERLAAEPGIAEGNKRFYRTRGRRGMELGPSCSNAKVSRMNVGYEASIYIRGRKPDDSGRVRVDRKLEYLTHIPTIRRTADEPLHKKPGGLCPRGYRGIPRRSLLSFISYATETRRRASRPSYSGLGVPLETIENTEFNFPPRERDELQ